MSSMQMVFFDRGNVVLICGAFALFCTISGGCGDGSVQTSGRVTIDGQPSGVGRLVLNRVGGGTNAQAAVDENGVFTLRAPGAEGVFPGTYAALFVQQVQGKIRERLRHALRGDQSVDELRVSYQSLTEAVTIPETGTDELVVDIRSSLGWRMNINE